MIENNSAVERGAHIILSNGMAGEILDIQWSADMREIESIEVLLENGETLLLSDTQRIFRIGKWIIGNKIDLALLKKERGEINKEIARIKSTLNELFERKALLRKQIFRYENNMIDNWKEIYTK